MNVNEKHFTFIYVLLVLGLGYAAMTLPISPLRILSSSANSVALYLTTLVGFSYFLYGTGRDVIKEIFDENNAAVAQFLGLFAIGLAIVIHG
jgi:tellurite resistance protein TehA-like permease